MRSGICDNPEDMRLLADFLRGMREKAGLSQRDLAEKLKATQAWVYHRENTHTQITLLEFVAWCRACDVDADPAFRRLHRALGV